MTMPLAPMGAHVPESAILDSPVSVGVATVADSARIKSITAGTRRVRMEERAPVLRRHSHVTVPVVSGASGVGRGAIRVGQTPVRTVDIAEDSNPMDRLSVGARMGSGEICVRKRYRLVSQMCA